MNRLLEQNQLRPEDRDMVKHVVTRALDTGDPFRFEARIVRPDGDARDVLSRGVCQVDDAGRTEAVFGIFLDLTDLRRMEKTVRRAERMASVGTLAAGVAHEINNPLTYIKGNIDLVSEEILAFSGGSPPTEGRVERVEPPAGTRGRVLVIDDDVTIGNLLSRALSGHHDVEVANGGQDGITRLEGATYDVVLCDLMMPDVTGRGVYEWMRDHRPESATRVVFVTGGAIEPELDAFLEEIPNHTLQKPFDVKALRALITEMIGRRGE